MTLDANIVYVGKSALNLYLLLCLGLKSPTLLKLTCDSELKIQDFKFLQEILPLLGARLAPLEPHGNLLPAKLEASGILPSRVELPVNTPVEFATALIACGPLYEKDLSILLPPSLANHRDIIRIVDVVARFRPETTIDGDTIYLRAAGFSMPSSPVIPDMDPALAGLMLALPYVAGGNIRLQGHWPSDHPLDGPTRELLLDFGLAPIFLPDAVYSSCETRLYPSRLDITNLTEELLPLATALAFASGKNTTIVCNTSRDDIGHSRDFLHHVGAEYQISTQGIHVSGIRPGKAEVWASPSPAWTLALSLVSFQQPGVCLSNPGIISEVWPSFWNIFTSLPEGPPPHAPTQIREEANEPEPVAGSGKRRIRI
ncbi:MAG: hypothetical protein EOM25_04665 [Deltaproteobacteria bacterium]|nr:hypothetical protein [Deltaproteobacteria bacterium]